MYEEATYSFIPTSFVNRIKALLEGRAAGRQYSSKCYSPDSKSPENPLNRQTQEEAPNSRESFPITHTSTIWSYRKPVSLYTVAVSNGDIITARRMSNDSTTNLHLSA
jgi:hypothetical protein